MTRRDFMRGVGALILAPGLFMPKPAGGKWYYEVEGFTPLTFPDKPIIPTSKASFSFKNGDVIRGLIDLDSGTIYYQINDEIVEERS